MYSTKEKIKHFYDDAVIRKLNGFIYSNARVEYAWNVLNEILIYKQPSHILEIGSGIGEICHRLASKFSDAKVVGFDISEESINISNNLFDLPNLSFQRKDSICELKLANDTKFDLIYLMDVFEHIPIDEREDVINFIKTNISKDGIIFFSCPTPQHLAYLKINNPSEIQPVDEDVSLELLIYFSKKSGLKLIHYKEVSVWKAADYFHAVFSNNLQMQPFSDFKPIKKAEIIGIGLKKELMNKMKKILNIKSRLDDTENVSEYKRELIRKSLGAEILEKVEAYGK